MPGAILVNGQAWSIASQPPHVTLLDFLRAGGLIGAKEGCAEGECGACAVAMVTPRGNGSSYTPINSCLMLVAAADGGEFYTVESLAGRAATAPAADPRLSAVQAAMAAGGGSQCGYCTPGFVVSLFAEHYRPDRSGPCDPLAMAGNLCRCTGYRPIRDAALSLGPAPDDAWRARLTRPAPPLDEVATPGFSRPRSVADCVAALAAHPGAHVLAGGTDVAVESNLRHQRWPHLVSIEAIAELREFSESPQSIRIGAGLALSEIGRLWKAAPAVIHEWLELFASPLIRHRATLGGNLSTASPIGDAAPLLLALDASLHIAGPGGRRELSLSSFFTGYRRTVLGQNELITTIEIPLPLPQHARFYKVAKRRLDDISTVAAGLAIDRDASGIVRRARFAFGGVAATPLRLGSAEEAVTGRPWRDAIARVSPILDAALDPMSDHRGSRRYRLDVSKRLIEKFAWEIG